METYQTALWNHLAAYANQRLGVFDQGTYRGKQYVRRLSSSSSRKRPSWKGSGVALLEAQ
jgi:hypothetical protein